MKRYFVVLGIVAGCGGGGPIAVQPGPLPEVVDSGDRPAVAAALATPGVTAVAIQEAHGRLVAYGLDAERNILFRITGTADALTSALDGAGIEYGFPPICMPKPQADVSGPLPCPPGPKGDGVPTLQMPQ